MHLRFTIRDLLWLTAAIWRPFPGCGLMPHRTRGLSPRRVPRDRRNSRRTVGLSGSGRYAG